MRFKAYAWSGITRPGDAHDMGYYTFEAIPGLSIDYNTTNMALADISDWWKAGRDYHGQSLWIQIKWLFWGITLDFRFGDDVRDA